MANNRPNITLPAGVWVDLYAASYIAVGEQLTVENTGSCDVYLAVQSSQPDRDHRAYNVLKRRGDPLQNNSGDPGAWAYCNNTDGLVNVSVKDANGFHPDTGSPTNGEADEAVRFRRALLSTLNSIELELHLLNARFEETFETNIDGGDVS